MKHAKLGASNAHRWLVCTASPAYEANFPEKSSLSAEEGILAHDIASQVLEGKKVKGNKGIVQNLLPYINYVNNLSGYRSIEVKLDYAEYVPNGFGTADCIVQDNETLTVIDLKYGQGVMVSAENNPQLKLYALGVLLMHKEIENVRMVIVQPRLDHISEAEITAKELLQWAESIRPIAKLAYEDKGTFVAGEHCRFCKGRAICKEREKENMALVRQDFAIELTDEDIVKILTKADDIIKWLNDIKEYALKEALAGKAYEGLKVVNGRSIRKVQDEIALANEILKDKTISPDQVYTTKLKGLTELEKLIGKKKFNDSFSKFIVKPEGKPVLVPISDKREELNSAEVFK